MRGDDKQSSSDGEAKKPKERIFETDPVEVEPGTITNHSPDSFFGLDEFPQHFVFIDPI